MAADIRRCAVLGSPIEHSLSPVLHRAAYAELGLAWEYTAVDVDEAELAESLELPGADLSGEELTVRVVPKQADEFTCRRCFLVRHRSQLADEKKGICRECAA